MRRVILNGHQFRDTGSWVIQDFCKKRLEFHTTDWRCTQPCRVVPLPTGRKRHRVLTIEKSVGEGDLIRKADITVLLDGDQVLRVEGVDILPEMGAILEAGDLRVARFVHRGTPSGVPEYLHLGGWQMLNVKSVRENLASLQRGLERSADAGVQLLVTPETSLTGLFPRDRVTRDRANIAKAEREVRRLLRKVKNAPYSPAAYSQRLAALSGGLRGERRRARRPRPHRRLAGLQQAVGEGLCPRSQQLGEEQEAGFRAPAARASGHHAAEDLDARNPSGRGEPWASRLLSRRIHVPIQPAGFTISRQAVLPAAPAGRAVGSDTVRRHVQARARTEMLKPQDIGGAWVKWIPPIVGFVPETSHCRQSKGGMPGKRGSSVE